MTKKISASVLILLLAFQFALAGDSTFIKVHFIYGSKPKRGHYSETSKWFGGLHGGHVGIEMDSDKIIDFLKDGDLHYIAHKRHKNSRFVYHQVNTFWEIFGTPSESVKKMSIIIPISDEQHKKLDSIASSYIKSTPYDYAFLGMRCGAASYDILSQLHIEKNMSNSRKLMKIFYPKRLRSKLIRQAKKHHWEMQRQEGAPNRKWEKD